MKTMKKVAAISVLSVALLLPGISQASEMKPMESGMMMQQDKPMESGMMMQQEKMTDIVDMTNYIPLRMFAETLGYSIMWDDMDRSITLTYMGLDMQMGMGMTDESKKPMEAKYMIKIMLDSKSAMVGMDQKMMAHAPMLMDGTTYVTRDFIAVYLLAPFMMQPM